MKYLLTVSLLGLCSPAFACPNLSGHFTCKDFESGAVQDVMTTQSAANGVTTYQMVIASEGTSKTYTYIADGVARAVENPDFTSISEKSTCQGSNLKIDINGIAKEGGAALNAAMIVNINAAGDMYDSYIGTLGTNPIHFEEVCQRVR